MTKPEMHRPTPTGIPCGLCGLPGLGLREVTRTLQDGEVTRTVRITAWSCCYCRTVVPLSRG